MAKAKQPPHPRIPAGKTGDIEVSDTWQTDDTGGVTT